MLKDRYGDEVRLAYNETDSFILKLETEDVYARFHRLGNYFDFKYEETHDNSVLTKNNKIEYFKAELGGHFMTEYVALNQKGIHVKRKT